MTPPDPLPDFHHALMLSRGRLQAQELAECHGLLCGMVCIDCGGGTAADFLERLRTRELLEEPGLALREVMVDAWDSTLQQLADEELQFALWLPDDDQPLDERTASLAQWCTGFLAGIGLGGALPELSDEAREALDDLQQIACAAYGSVADEAALDESGEEDEHAFAEIVEYVRVVTLLLREELRGPGDEDAIH